ncbi:DoxX family membrane protein [Streptomyces gossypii]|uniref:DoxX family membrane protein n=1 Tax=Streptomyces gossypii TaxID=2883101 RepID=UPI0021A539DA|nr:DoxX family membrane protein [Streptomyces gossypii]
MSVGLTFIWFGAMKFFPQASPAEHVAIGTMDALTFGLVPADASRPLLALFETVIGLGLVTGVLLRVALAAFFVHMAGVCCALFLLPEEMWNGALVTPTLEGQYVIKNVVLIAACLAVAADERPT